MKSNENIDIALGTNIAPEYRMRIVYKEPSRYERFMSKTKEFFSFLIDFFVSAIAIQLVVFMTVGTATAAIIVAHKYYGVW